MAFRQLSMRYLRRDYLESSPMGKLINQQTVAEEGSRRSHTQNLCWFGRLTSHIPPGQFLRYLLVGGWNTLFGYATYAAFTALLMPRVRFGYILASAFSSVINITASYLGYKFFVFKTQGNYLAEWLRCLAVYGSGMLPGLLLLPLTVGALHYVFHLQGSAPYVAGALLTGVGVLYSFFGHKHFTFRVPSDAAQDAAAETAMQEVTPGIIENETKRR